MADMKYRKQLANIARDYYFSNLSIADISEKYDLSRYLITKSLDEALESGLVRISINAPIDRNLELEAYFKKTFGIQNAFIIKDTDTPDDDINNIIQFSSEEIQERIHHCKTVGLSWGQTVLNVINHFQTEVREDLLFTQITGDNMKYNSGSASTPLVQKAAAKFNAHYQTIPAPLYLMNDSVRSDLKNEPAFIPSFAAINKLDLILSGIGTLASIDTVPVWKQHKAEIFENVDLSQVVGMLYGRPYDVNGNILTTDKDKLFGAGIDQLLTVPNRFVVVKSKFKARALLGALRGHLITDFVSNEAICNRVLMEMDI